MTHRKPLVSVVIPTCNRRDVLARCLAALARQTYPAFEIIVVDDCSTDDTPAFLSAFPAEHPQLAVRTLRNETHAGANPSRNRGIRVAEGEFVAFLDSDCIAEPDWLDRLVDGFESRCVGAVTGLVEDSPPRNLFDLTFKGTHRLHRAGRAHRLIAGNMCVRRDVLIKYALDEDRSAPVAAKDGQPDVSVSGRGDEEGLFLILRAAGHEVRTAPRAIVNHEHHLNARSFFRQAWRGGRAAARLVFKYRLPPRLDLLPFLLAYVSIPLVLVQWWLGAIPLFFFAGALAALVYNDLFRKGKTAGETLRSFPLLVMYYHVRLVGYVAESLRLRLTRHNLKRVRLDRIPRDFVNTECP